MKTPCRPRRLTHRLTCPLTHRTTRRLTRRIGRGPRVNYLSQALTAFTRAIRAHVRLIRIAPEIFDDTVVRRDAAQRAERKVLHAELTVALDKIYGPTPPEELHQSQNENRCRNGAETVQFSRRKTAAIEVHMAELDLWLSAGRAAFARHQHLRPHRMLPLGTVARMLDIASRFGRLACGLDWPRLRNSRTTKGDSSRELDLAEDMEHACALSAGT